jgi:hypothetical protein
MSPLLIALHCSSVNALISVVLKICGVFALSALPLMSASYTISPTLIFYNVSVASSSGFITMLLPPSPPLTATHLPLTKCFSTGVLPLKSTQATFVCLG